MRSNKNTTTSLPMQPVAPVVHNHPQGYTGLALVIGGFVLALFPALWWGLCFLFDKLGSRNPEYSAATLVAIVICGAVLWWPATWLIGNISATNHAHKVEIMDKVHEFELARARLQLQAATTIPTGGNDRLTNDSDYTKSQLALAVLQIAYQHGPYKPNEARPWVRDRAYSLGVPGVTSAMAAGLAAWMAGNGLLVDNQVNVAKYLTWEAARRMLARRYAPAVLVNARTTSLSDADTYSVIDNVK